MVGEIESRREGVWHLVFIFDKLVSMIKIVLLNGFLIDPQLKTSAITNILISNGIVTGFGYLPDETEDQLKTIDIHGCYIVPADVDPNTCTIEPTAKGVCLLKAPSFVVIDTKITKAETPSTWYFKTRNLPFIAHELAGAVRFAIQNGKILDWQNRDSL